MTGKSSNSATDSDYALVAGTLKKIPAPELPYRPRDPKKYHPRIALIGAGGITRSHLTAYKAAGYDIAVICNRSIERAKHRAAEFFPNAHVTTDLAEVLEDTSIEVLDIATPPLGRVQLIEQALKAGRHVLSQKPFVLDLETGHHLVELARDNGVKLAVNQNARWAPHFSYMREAVRAGLIGQVNSVHCAIHWNHGWIAGTPFEKINDIILSDFGVHWFDFLASIIGDRAKSVFASSVRSGDQTTHPPLFAQAMITLDHGQASLVFDGGTAIGTGDTTVITGSKGSLTSSGPDLGNQTVKLVTSEGEAQPVLSGTWFCDGFHGAMAELLCAIEENREPLNNAADNLKSLAICFAAIKSANTGESIQIGVATSI